jgi:hypothetical protein
MAKKRVTRDTPSRRGPIRNRAFRGGTGFGNASANGRSGESEQDKPRSSTGALQGAVEGTVATAYTVIEQYMKRGQAAASRHYDTSPNSGTNGDPRGNRAPYAGSGTFAWDPWDPAAWMGPWTEALRVWSEGMARFADTAAAGWDRAPSAPAAGRTRTVSVEVQSPKPVSVILDLEPNLEDQRLTLGPLVHAGDSEVTLGGVELELEEGRCTVRLEVEESQPSAAYVGVVEDRRGQRLGEITVVVRDRAAPPRRSSSKATEKG